MAAFPIRARLAISKLTLSQHQSSKPDTHSCQTERNAHLFQSEYLGQDGDSGIVPANIFIIKQLRGLSSKHDILVTQYSKESHNSPSTIALALKFHKL